MPLSQEELRRRLEEGARIIYKLRQATRAMRALGSKVMEQRREQWMEKNGPGRSSRSSTEDE